MEPGSFIEILMEGIRSARFGAVYQSYGDEMGKGMDVD